MSNLQLSVEETSPPVIQAVGELNYKNCEELRVLIREVLGRDHASVALALDELDFVDSSGLRILVSAAQHASTLGRPLSLISVTSQLHHMLEVSGFTPFFEATASPSDRTTKSASPSVIGTFSCSFSIATNTAACRGARNRICDFAQSMGFGAPYLDDIKLVVGEAVSNAVRHGAPEGAHIGFQCRVDHGKISIVLSYPSAMFDPASVPVPDHNVLAEGGMGIYFMKLLMDTVQYDFEGDHVILTLEKSMR